MICDNCKIERLEKDFINNQKFCYRCEYRKKLLNSPKKRTKKPIYCRMCGDEVVHDKSLKKNPRTSFCSVECANEGHKISIDNHWTRKVRKAVDGAGWEFNNFKIGN